ncbi:MAG: pentapeptide repeat-containing protein, partial [Caulobacter sp.]
MSVSHTSLAGRRRLTQAELDLMVAAHERFLTGKPGGKRASLRFLDLSRLDLATRDLTDADL